jgi:hypothetical protein
VQVDIVDYSTILLFVEMSSKIIILFFEVILMQYWSYCKLFPSTNL